MGAETIQEHRHFFSHARFCKDFVNVDSTEHSIDETIAAIKKVIK